MLRVVFMGTPPLVSPLLEALHQHHQVIEVYTQPDKPSGRGLAVRPSPLKKKALECGLSVRQPLHLSQEDEWQHLQSLRPDVIVVAAYGHILKKRVLDLPPLGCVNIHFSLLPRWRGAAPIQWAILAGDAETGLTTMRMSEKCDEGAILFQEKMIIGPEETTQSLQEQLSRMAPALTLRTLDHLGKNKNQGQAQEEKAVTWAPKVLSHQGWFQPDQTAAQLDRLVRALGQAPGTGIWVQGRWLKIKKSRLGRPVFGSPAPGKLFQESGKLFLSTSEGCLELLTIQWEGKKETEVIQFLNGLRGTAVPPMPWSIEWRKKT